MKSIIRIILGIFTLSAISCTQPDATDAVTELYSPDDGEIKEQRLKKSPLM